MLSPSASDLLGVERGRFEREARRAAAHCEEARDILRALAPEQPLAGRTVLLVSEGIGIGAAESVAIAILRGRGAERLVLGAPVGARGAVRRLRPLVDTLVCAL